MIQPFFQSDRQNLIIQAALEGHMARHRSILNNIANVDTPGYERIEVNFEKELKKAIKDLRPSPSSRHGDSQPAILDFAPRVKVDKSLPLRMDGSNVSIDMEMAALNKNSGRINVLLEVMNRNYRMLKAAVSGRP